MTKSVLISGASSGIGKALSLRLDQAGYQVFSAVRQEKDAQALRAQSSPNLLPLIIDITIPETITSASSRITDITNGELFCLVNNAGISLSGSLEFMPIQDFRQQIEVNLVGQLALTQACLPLLRKSGGRVIFISSAAGRLATAFNGPYSSSKAALIAMADAMRLELMPWHIQVSTLIVGSVQTPIWEKGSRSAKEILRKAPADAWNLYGRAQKRAGAFYHQMGINGMQVEKAARYIQKLLEAKHLKEYALVGSDAWMIELAAKLLPVRMRDWLVRNQMGLLQE